jgi:hypothetical protein
MMPRRAGRTTTSTTEEEAFVSGYRGASAVNETDYANLWSEIKYALRKAEVPLLSRSKKRAGFLKINECAKELIDTIANGPLDLPAYEFLPADVARDLFQKDKWSDFRPDERCESAHRLLSFTSWPPITEILAEIAERAERHSSEALTVRRIVDRDTQDREFNYFIRHMSAHFRKHLNGPMHGTLARIASAAFGKEVTEDQVKRALRHARPKEGA